MNFNQHFGITGTEYIDIPIDGDIELYLDPSKVKDVDPDIFDSVTAKVKIDSYFTTVIDLYQQGNKELAISLLETPREINAAHLGLSKSSSKGNGPSREILSRFFEKITNDGRLTTSVLTRPVLIPLFVRNFGPDRFSDLLVNIISMELADFTKSICDRYGIETTRNSIYTYYNIENHQWEKLNSDLPIGPDGKPILLTPGTLTTTKYDFSPRNYVYTIIFSYIQNELLEHENPYAMYQGIKPTKSMLYQSEVRDAYTEIGKLKDYALDESLEKPHLLEQYIDKVEGTKNQIKKDNLD